MAVSLTTFSPNTTAQSSQVNANFQALSNQIRPTFSFAITGSVTTGISLTPILIVPIALTIEKAYLAIKTAPTGADLIIDINKNGTSIWSSTQANRVKITAGNTTGSQTSFDTTSLAEGDLLTIDVDQVGSTVSGADITIELKCS